MDIISATKRRKKASLFVRGKMRFTLEKQEMLRLVAAAKQKDKDAFAKLYEGYYKALFKAAYYILGNRQDAEDTVMDTVVDVYGSIDKVRNDEAFDGWIFKILYNKARRKRGTLIYTATSELNEAVESSKDGDYETISENVDLMNSLFSLSREERTIVVLSVLEGYSSLEISKIMSLNANTVRSKQMRAIAKMRSVLEKQ